MRGVGARLGVVVGLLAAGSVGSGSALAGPSGGALPPQLVQVVRVAGRAGVPVDASMVAVNVTVVGPAEAGFVSVFACDGEMPDTSNVNYFADQVVPNLVMSRVSGDGTICVATSAVTDVVVDLVGFVPAGSAVVPLVSPVRRLDTRDAGGPRSPLRAGSVTEVEVAGRDGVPADASVVMFNATAVAGGEAGYLTVFPCGRRPGTSSVNYQPGQVVPNLVTTRVSAAGTICVYNLSAVDVIIDLAAYATDGITTLASPQRVIDTRDDGDIDPAGSVLRLDIAGRDDVPDDATAAVYNLTSVDATGLGYATSYPCDVDRPEVSNLNYAPGAVTANGTITKLAANGELCIYQLAPTNLIVDLIGYTRGTTHYQPLTPTRILDTRKGWKSTCPWVFQGTINTETVELLNVETREVKVIRRPSPPGYSLNARPTMNRACDAILWWQDKHGPDKGLYQLGIDGSERLLFAKPPNMNTGVIEQVVEMDDGTMLGLSQSAVIDLRDGSIETMLGPMHVTPTGSQLLDIDASPSGVVAQLSGSDTDARLDIFDMATGRRLGRYDPGGGANMVSVSPDGRYIAVTAPRDINNPDDDLFVVVTAFGDPVDGFVGTAIRGVFTGKGSLVLCVESRSLFEWDLFDDARHLGIDNGWGSSESCEMMLN